MAAPSLPELEAQRAWLYGQLGATGDFRRGTVSENYRRCGKPNCACARPEHPGHRAGPQVPRPVPGRGTRGRQLAPEEVDKVRRELVGYQQFGALSEQIVEVTEAICEAWPVSAPAAGGGSAREEAEREKWGSAPGSRPNSPPR